MLDNMSQALQRISNMHRTVARRLRSAEPLCFEETLKDGADRWAEAEAACAEKFHSSEEHRKQLEYMQTCRLSSMHNIFFIPELHEKACDCLLIIIVTLEDFNVHAPTVG